MSRLRALVIAGVALLLAVPLVVLVLAIVLAQDEGSEAPIPSASFPLPSQSPTLSAVAAGEVIFRTGKDPFTDQSIPRSASAGQGTTSSIRCRSGS